jgi:hypothetical protein
MMMGTVIGRTFMMKLVRFPTVEHWVEVMVRFNVTKPHDVEQAESAIKDLKAIGFTSHMDIEPKRNVKRVFLSKDGTADELRTWTAEEEYQNMAALADVFGKRRIPFSYASLEEMGEKLDPLPTAPGKAPGIYPIRLKAQ